MKRFWLVLALLIPLAAAANPVLFITQTPISEDFTTIAAVFGHHRGNVSSAPRGGDLYIIYDDGTLRNLTAEAGYGTVPLQEIAVRDPAVHWTGTKALFCMAIGGTKKNDYTTIPYFQIYEVTGIEKGGAAAIRKVAQPEEFNNVSPIYASIGGAGTERILFTSDRPRNGARILYPQRDEYESAPTVSGIWSMNPDGGDLKMLDHAPSGDFKPIIDSFGRVIFTRWDHLQRDQQADSDIDDIVEGRDLGYESFTYESEESNAYHALAPADEVYPESRGFHGDNATVPNPVWDFQHQPTELRHSFNQFIPWMMNQDGSALETLNHIGRHEYFNYIQSSRTYLDDFYGGEDRTAYSFMSLVEDPTRPGYFYGIDAPEFSTHAAGQIIGMKADPALNADDAVVDYYTHPDTRSYIDDGENPTATQIGHFRDLMARSDGTLWAVHSSSPYVDRAVTDDPGAPQPFPISSRYDFAIKQIVDGPGGYKTVGPRLVANPIVKTVTYFDNYRYRDVVYSGPMWEMSPVEVIPRTPPAAPEEAVPAIEQAILDSELGGAAGVQGLRNYLRTNNLALIVSRDVTRRADKQQDYNLKVYNSAHESKEPGATPAELAWMRFYEGKQVRGYREIDSGRRVLARPMQGDLNPPVDAAAPQGSVEVASDGSVAAFVPAARALSWETIGPDTVSVVRERYWLTFQPGEIRTCTNCHGINRTDVLGNPPPANPPEALRNILRWWKQGHGGGVADYLLGRTTNATGLDTNGDGTVDVADLIAVGM